VRGGPRSPSVPERWEQPDLVERLAADPAVDFVDLHIYPLATPRLDLLAAARHMVDVARRGYPALDATSPTDPRRALTASNAAAAVAIDAHETTPAGEAFRRNAARLKR
jgi:hypothetical protein